MLYRIFCEFVIIIKLLDGKVVQAELKLLHLAFPRSGWVASAEPEADHYQRGCHLRQSFARNSKYDKVLVHQLTRRRPANRHFLQICVYHHQPRPVSLDVWGLNLASLNSCLATRLYAADAVSERDCFPKSEWQRHEWTDWRVALAGFAVTDVSAHTITLAYRWSFRADSTAGHSAVYQLGGKRQHLKVRVPGLSRPRLAPSLRITLRRETSTPHCTYLRQHFIPKQELDCFIGRPKASHLDLLPLQVSSSI